MRKPGLACDNLVGAELVSATGAPCHAREDLRGGGNFGVVTEFELRLHHVGTVLGGMVAWPAAQAGEGLRF